MLLEIGAPSAAPAMLIQNETTTIRKENSPNSARESPCRKISAAMKCAPAMLTGPAADEP